MKKILFFSSFIVGASLLIGMNIKKTDKVYSSTTVKKEIILQTNSNKAIINDEIKEIDDKNLDITPIKDTTGVIQIPLRFISQNYGFDVSWNGNKSINIKSNNKEIYLYLDKKEMLIDNESIDMKTKPINKDGTIFMPAKYLVENILELKLEVNTENNLIGISEKGNLLTKEKMTSYLDKFETPLRVNTKENYKKLVKDSYTKEIKEYRNFDADGGFVVRGQTGTDELEMPELAAAEYEKSSSVTEDQMAGGDFHKTNTQVKGVDEADIVKTDGKYIYYIANESLVVVDASKPENANIIKQIDYASKDDIVKKPKTSFSPSEAYLDDETLTVIGYENENYYEKDVEVYENKTSSDIVDMMMPYFDSGKTKVIVYDIKNKSKINEKRTFTIDGNYNTSRKIGDYVYLVTNKSVYVYGNDDVIIPRYKDSAISNEEREIDFKTMCYFPNVEASNTLTITSINTKDASKNVTIESYLGFVQGVYASLDNIYVTSTNYKKEFEETEIYKFAIDKEEIDYKTKIKVPGSILNQFSMDEYKGNFRVVTTVNDFSRGALNTSNNLYIANENGKIVGKIEKMAKGESIKSARFLGDKIYMVTFEQIDPLFVIDAKNPENPSVLGELKIPGYSTYLHPYDENHLIGLGYDTEAKNGVVTTNGMKMSMFDITDFNNPKEMFTETIGGFGTYSSVLSDHKTLMFDKNKGLIGFPVSIYYKDDLPEGYTEAKFDGAVVYNLDLKNGFKLKTKINHTGGIEYYNGISRIIYIGDTFYTFSGNGIVATDMNTSKKIKTINLEFDY